MGFWLWTTAFGIGVTLVFFLIYYLIQLSDLKNDFLNPIDAVDRINKYVGVEYGFHGFLCLLLLLTGHGYYVLANLPILAFHGFKLATKSHMLDCTDVFVQLQALERVTYGKLVLMLLLLFMYLYNLVTVIVVAMRDDSPVLKMFMPFM